METLARGVVLGEFNSPLVVETAPRARARSGRGCGSRRSRRRGADVELECAGVPEAVAEGWEEVRFSDPGDLPKSTISGTSGPATARGAV
jgi:hypothetical protein